MSHSIRENIKQIRSEIGNIKLVVVSKYRTIAELHEVYETDQRDFGENKVQELVNKYNELPKDIKWHIIGHLQSNKVKYIAPFVDLIHSVDSLKLLQIVNKEAEKQDRIISFLFQLHIAQEDSKYGLLEHQLSDILSSNILPLLKNVKCKGLMGMATNTTNTVQVEKEFTALKLIYDKYSEENQWDTLSMGMSGDYPQAISCGSTMIRVGSKIFN